MRSLPLLPLVWLLAAGSATARQASSPEAIPRFVIDDSADARLSDQVIARLGSSSIDERPAVRVILDRSDWAPGTADAFDIRTNRDVAGLWLVAPAPLSLDDVEPWRGRLRGALAAHAARIVVLEIAIGNEPAQLAQYVLRIAATEARAARPGLLLAAGGPATGHPESLRAFYTPALAPYVDLVAVPAGADLPSVQASIDTIDPGTGIAVTGNDAGADLRTARERVVSALLWTVGTAIVSHTWRGEAAALAEAWRALTAAGLASGISLAELDRGAASLRIRRGDEDVTASVRHRLLFDDRTMTTVLVCDPGTAGGARVSLRLPNEAAPVVHDPIVDGRQPASGYTWDAASSTAAFDLPASGRPLLVRFDEGAAAGYTDRTGVTAARALTVGEIVANHQRQQAAQDARIRSYIAEVRLEQHFRPTITDPGYDVVTENRYFVDASGIEWEERSFSVNGSRWGADRPPFPLLQPEKVLSLPLQLRFDDDYRYTLAGAARTDGHDTYVVRFEPTSTDRSLYRGTIWIDRETFSRVRVQAVQTQLSPPVVSNEETHVYRAVRLPDGSDAYLLSELEARQILMIAGRNLLLEKKAVFDRFAINAADFDEQRAAARASDRVMFRETDRGLRYYVKEGDRRVVSEKPTSRAKAMAMGVLIDPSYAFPLPIFGINYLDFEFGRQDTQFALLFGGVLAAGNIQRKLAGTPFDASLDFFGIAAPATDRLYHGGDEREGERLLTWPANVGVNLGWQYTPFQKATAQYQLRFDGYVRDRTTDDSFAAPASTVTNGIGGAWEYRRAGYSVVVGGTWFSRGRWKAWGPATGPVEAPYRTYLKYNISVARNFYLGPLQKFYVNAAYFGGRRLDRFSRYQFGLFDDTRIHGVPASGIRFDEVALVRGSYSFDLFGQYRLDLFADQGWGRDRLEGGAWEPITGIGAAVNLRAPFDTMLRADVGQSFLPSRYSGLGSTVLQIMLLKPLR